MFGRFKRKDIVSELEKHVEENEDLYVESIPNKGSYIFYMLIPYLFFGILLLIANFLFLLIKPQEFHTFFQIAHIALFALNSFMIIFILVKIVLYYSEVLNTYYVVTNKGIHKTKGGQTLNYSFIDYNDIKSVIISANKIKNKGHIFIRNKADETPKGLLKKILLRRDGLLAVDDVKEIYIILEQVGGFMNPEIFFTDTNDTLEEIGYFKEVKKYSERIPKVDKNQSLIDKRNQQGDV